MKNEYYKAPVFEIIPFSKLLSQSELNNSVLITLVHVFNRGFTITVQKTVCVCPECVCSFFIMVGEWQVRKKKQRVIM